MARIPAQDSRGGARRPGRLGGPPAILAGSEAAEMLEWLWPVLLIAAGVVVIGAAVLGRGKGPGGGPG